jgi:ribosome-associated protein
MKKIAYNISMGHEYIELNHLLKHVGLAESGGAGGALVASGVVMVDGQVETRKRNKIRAGQIVQAGGMEITVGRDAS